MKKKKKKKKRTKECKKGRKMINICIYIMHVSVSVCMCVLIILYVHSLFQVFFFINWNESRIKNFIIKFYPFKVLWESMMWNCPDIRSHLSFNYLIHEETIKFIHEGSIRFGWHFVWTMLAYRLLIMQSFNFNLFSILNIQHAEFLEWSCDTGYSSSGVSLSHCPL